MYNSTSTTALRRLTLLAACVALVSAPACDSADELDAQMEPMDDHEADDTEDEDAPAPVVLEQEPAASEYVFGLDEQQVMSLYDLVPRTHSPEEWLQLHVAPFQCAPYGTLCADIGAGVTEQIMAQGYAMALDGASVAELDEFIAARIDEAAEAAEAAETEVLQPREWKESFFYCGSSNKRLKVRAKSSKVLLTTKMKGECVCAMQNRPAGIWTAEDADEIELDCSLNYDGGPVEATDYQYELNENKLTFTEPAQHSDSLVTITACWAALDTWECSGTVANST